MPRHLVIPDAQIYPGDRSSKHTVDWITEVIRVTKPDVIVCLGDWWDMPSLSSYDRGKAVMAGRSYTRDIAAGAVAIQQITRASKSVRKIFTIGNHEERIVRYANSFPELVGKVSYDDLGLEPLGWEVYDFLQPATIHGITYCHFFPRGANGLVMQTKNGAPSARVQAIREARSSTAGHRQGFDYFELSTPRGVVQSMIAGSCYRGDFDYLCPQGTRYWRGVIVKDVSNGNYDFRKVSLGRRH